MEVLSLPLPLLPVAPGPARERERRVVRIGVDLLRRPPQPLPLWAAEEGAGRGGVGGVVEGLGAKDLESEIARFFPGRCFAVVPPSSDITRLFLFTCGDSRQVK